MGQVVRFLGLLLLGIGGTLVIFSHLSMGMVYGWDKLAEQVASDPTGTMLSIVAFVPGGIVYGLGILVEKIGKRSDEKWAALNAQRDVENSASESSDQAES
ncbi:hypothetical protein [Magnetovibrio blakemorei]|uniref:Uncharacterized protein n=1 Tax=Magnetovibrio blakemorei TaxID=28181 RepID=A0A1E5Q421_9PROT|nr:hypothetical protein [Magnetovibrio blakemorei]OEJ64676.1 hypothetical protein BEN30_00870 [Magnetovibrio blakemorei]